MGYRDLTLQRTASWRAGARKQLYSVKALLWDEEKREQRLHLLLEGVGPLHSRTTTASLLCTKTHTCAACAGDWLGTTGKATLVRGTFLAHKKEKNRSKKHTTFHHVNILGQWEVLMC